MPSITEYKLGVLSGVGLTLAIKHPFRTAKIVSIPARFLAADLGIPVASAILGSTTATVGAAGMLGYATGATAGTIISHQIWGDKGAQDALDFYRGKGKHDEYFDIGGNIQTIASHFKEEIWNSVGGRWY